MSQWINRQFKNNTNPPVVVQVCALAEGLPGGQVSRSDRITQIITTDTTVGSPSECGRMRRWIGRTFIGKTASEFCAHNGTVPSAEEEDEAHYTRRQAERVPRKDDPPRAVNIHAHIELPSLSPDMAKKLADTIRQTIARDSARPDVGHKHFAYAPHPGTYWQDRKRTGRFFLVLSKTECSGHTRIHTTRVDYNRGGEYDWVYLDGTQWDKLFKQVGKHEVPPTEVFDLYETTVLFNEGRIEVSFNGNKPVEAADLTDEQIERVVNEHSAEHPGVRDFLIEQRAKGIRLRNGDKTVEDCKARFDNTTNFGSPYTTLAESYTGMKYVPARRAPMRILKPLYFKHPANIGKTNAEETEARVLSFYGSPDALRSKPLSDALFTDFVLATGDLPDYTREFLNAVKHSGHELPPRAGERYFSVVTGNTYTVIDSTLKMHSTDYYVTMQRDGDQHRTKFTYRNHAEWLTTWRPVDDEGKARETVQVDVEPRNGEKAVLKVIVDSADAMREIGVAMHEAAEENRRYFAAFEDSAVYDLVRIGHELDKRLPNWKELPSTPPGRFSAYTESDLMIRALRTLTRQRDNASADLQKARRDFERVRDERNELHASLKVRTRERDELLHERGGSWGPERIKTEQTRMRDMLREFGRLFKAKYGLEYLLQAMQKVGCNSIIEMPLEKYVDFMRDCRTYAEKARDNTLPVGPVLHPGKPPGSGNPPRNPPLEVG